MLIAVTGCQYLPQSAVQPDPALSPEEFMTKYDENRDGRISIEEFDGRLRVFFALDQNNDSFIVADEAPEVWPPVR